MPKFLYFRVITSLQMMPAPIQDLVFIVFSNVGYECCTQ